MKKNNLLITLCLFFFINSFSQKICGEIMYKEESRISLFYQTISITKFNDKIAYTKFLHWKKARPFLNGEYDANEISDNEELFVSSNDETSFVYNSRKETYFSNITWKKTMIVKEDDFKWSWKLLGEKKKIGKFNCQNASIRFRGRNFIAWFTTEIPVPFGPRKFKGLPGLILEIYDDEKTWYMKAINVKVEKKKKCPINFNLINTKKKAISLGKFLKKADSLHINSIKREASKLPKGNRITIPDGCERLYDGSMLEIFEMQ